MQETGSESFWVLEGTAVAMKILVALFVVTLLAGSRVNGQAKANGQGWVDSLKNMPVAKLEPGLPEKPFHQWLTSLTHSAQPKYQAIDCEAAGAGSTGDCIVVKADASLLRAVELTFAVSAERVVHPEEAAFIFVCGIIGSGDPRSKQPTRLIRKLSELEAVLK